MKYALTALAAALAGAVILATAATVYAIHQDTWRRTQ